MMNHEPMYLNPIGVIHTPYAEHAPYQPVENDDQKFWVELAPEYAQGLHELHIFSYIYLLYHIHLLVKKVKMAVLPPWAGGKEVGLFASRSPVRPNPIGISIVRIKRIADNIVYTSGLDVFDQTPLLDIKPYIKDLDSKPDANYGWLEDMEDLDHLLLHIRGIPHEY